MKRQVNESKVRDWGKGERQESCWSNNIENHEVLRWGFLFLKSAHKHKYTHLFYSPLN